MSKSKGRNDAKKAKARTKVKVKAKPETKATVTAKTRAKAKAKAKAKTKPEGSFDFAALEQRIAKAAQEAFRELAAAHPAEQLCAFALYSDGGAMTVCPSTNTAAHLAQKQADDPDDADYQQFAPAEWAFESEGADADFNTLCDDLRAAHSAEHDDEWFEQFQGSLYESCVRALEALVRKGFFEQVAGREVLVLFQADPGDADAEAERAMIERLNGPEIIAQHRRWTASWG